jgi:splicing suppressor protein 51
MGQLPRPPIWLLQKLQKLPEEPPPPLPVELQNVLEGPEAVRQFFERNSLLDKPVILGNATIQTALGTFESAPPPSIPQVLPSPVANKITAGPPLFTCSDDACTTCGSSGRSILQPCCYCQTPRVFYCSRMCRNNDWKNHRQQCWSGILSSRKVHFKGSLFNDDREKLKKSKDRSTRRARKGLIFQKPFPFEALEKDKWLSKRPRPDVYALLIDAFRLREDDEAESSNCHQVYSIYGTADTSFSGLQNFLLIAQRNERLPSWWTTSDYARCCELGSRGRDSYHSVSRFLEAKDVDARYGAHERMPAQLRIFAWKVYGFAVLRKDMPRYLNACIYWEIRAMWPGPEGVKRAASRIRVGVGCCKFQCECEKRAMERINNGEFL